MIDVQTYCENKPGAIKAHPFRTGTISFKVNDKNFALMPNGGEDGRITLKCDPDRARMLREVHPEITPGYHMNKQHWNTLDLNGTLSEEIVFELIDHSYNLITGN